MKTLIRILAVLLLLALITLLVPSSVPMVIAEGTSFPVYEPVTLDMTGLEPLDWTQTAPYYPNRSGFSADNYNYDDQSVHIRSEKIRAYDTDILVTWVQIADATQLRTKLTNDKIEGVRTMRLSGPKDDKLAYGAKAVLAINGDNCKDTEYKGSGFIVRNTKVLRQNGTNFDALYIDKSGDMHILAVDESIPKNDRRGYIKDQLVEHLDEIAHSFNFGPGLVIDGELVPEEQLNRTRHNAPDKRAQRIALCQLDTLTYMIVATEGPEDKGSKGLKIPEFAQLVYDLGAKQAYNLDGGSSVCVCMNYKKINTRRTAVERAVTDAICFVTLVPD